MQKLFKQLTEVDMPNFRPADTPLLDALLLMLLDLIFICCKYSF